RAFPRDVMQASFRASQELYAELGAQNPRFKRLYEQWDRFRTEQVQWARVAEDTLANFMAIATAQR
ncbi:MAG TPA: ABC transporter substrate-binding protein, partial [Acetobacteraceae bacterium]|nr:ABC transporter substrate-binding protein [Acetobacteraceae bacterium]